MTNFTERDLVALFQDAGFCDIHMEFHIGLKKTPGMSWDAFLDSAPFPVAATQRESFGKHFASEEVMLLEKIFRILAEKGESHTRTSVAYLTAVKPVI